MDIMTEQLVIPGFPEAQPAPLKDREWQRRQILNVFEQHEGKATTLQLADVAVQYNARIYELRKSGYRIVKEKKLLNGYWQYRNHGHP